MNKISASRDGSVSVKVDGNDHENKVYEPYTVIEANVNDACNHSSSAEALQESPGYDVPAKLTGSQYEEVAAPKESPYDNWTSDE